MKRYILIYSDCGGKDTITIHGESEYDALIKAYSYIGEDYKLSANEMRVLFNNSDFKRVCEIFQNFSDVDILWFSEAKNPFVDKLNIMAELSGINIECSTCKYNVEYPPRIHAMYVQVWIGKGVVCGSQQGEWWCNEL